MDTEYDRKVLRVVLLKLLPRSELRNIGVQDFKLSQAEEDIMQSIHERAECAREAPDMVQESLSKRIKLLDEKISRNQKKLSAKKVKPFYDTEGILYQ